MMHIFRVFHVLQVFVKLATVGALGDQVQRWINPPNLQFFATAILFGLR